MFDFYCLYLWVPICIFLRNVAKISSCTNVYTHLPYLFVYLSYFRFNSLGVFFSVDYLYYSTVLFSFFFSLMPTPYHQRSHCFLFFLSMFERNLAVHHTLHSNVYLSLRFLLYCSSQVYIV